MSEYLIQDSTLTNIANSIRSKTGKADPILTENMATEIDSITGGGGNPLEYAYNLEGVYERAIFPKDYELVLTVPHLQSTGGSGNNTNCWNAFTDSKNLKSVKFINNGTPCELATLNMFNGCRELEIVDFSEFSNGIVNLVRCDYMFSACQKLKEIRGILDFSNNDLGNNNWLFASNVVEVRILKNSIKKNFRCEASLLSDESIQSIIDGLATVEAPQTLTLNYAVKAKLTPEQQQTISAKNWILA